MSDVDDAPRCDTCDSRRHRVCTGFPGAIYANHGQGWFHWTAAQDLEATGVEVHWSDVWAYSRYGIRPPQRVVVVDTETTGLDPRDNEMLEVAWFDMDYDEIVHSAIVPHTLANFTREALEVNRYRERDLGNMENWCEPRRLREVLSAVFEGATIAGSNVDFDRSFLKEWDWHVATWDHQPLQLGSVAAGFTRKRYPIRMRDIPTELGLSSTPDHTAAGDVRVVVEALRVMWGDQ